MNKIISFREGTTIISHGGLISFLQKDDFGMFHRNYSDFEFNLYRNLSKVSNQDLPKGIEGRIDDSFDFIVETGFAEWVDVGVAPNQCEILEFKQPQILHMLVMLTNKCNMSCKYCYTEANQYIDEPELTKKEWINLFDTVRIASKYRTQNISFTGGEPTIYPDFIDILKAVSGKYKIEISSNGLYFSDALIETLENLEGLNFLNISVDSYKPAEDEFMRGVGTYRRRLENIRHLYQRDIPLCFGVGVNSVTVNSLEETTRYFLEEFPETSIKYIPITKMGLALHLDDSIFLSKEDADKYLSNLLQMKEEYQEQILIDPSSFYDKERELHWSGRCLHMKFESERNLHIDSISKQNRIINPEKCNAAYGVVAISPSGRMRPCLKPDSFFSDVSSRISRGVLMPNIVNLTKKEIASLPFWQIVKQESKGFKPLETCALKYSISEEVGGEE